MTVLELELARELAGLPAERNGTLRPPPELARWRAAVELVARVNHQLGVRPHAAPIEAYGPTSTLTEDDLLRGYGLLPPEDDR